MTSDGQELWSPARTLGLVLAGGRSVRMGRDKALIPWQGRPLALHVAGILARQASSVALSGGGAPARLDHLGLTVLPDDVPDQGPLGGIVAGLRYAASQNLAFLLTAPCDAPFVPANLAQSLAAALGSARAAMPRSRRGIEPLFALWRVSSLTMVERARGEGMLGVAAVLKHVGAVEVAFHPSAEPDPFANLNEPHDLVR